jgi:hypothetical protein
MSVTTVTNTELHLCLITERAVGAKTPFPCFPGPLLNLTSFQVSRLLKTLRQKYSYFLFFFNNIVEYF